jgi:hypothetical protein
VLVWQWRRSFSHSTAWVRYQTIEVGPDPAAQLPELAASRYAGCMNPCQLRRKIEQAGLDTR